MCCLTYLHPSIPEHAVDRLAGERAGPYQIVAPAISHIHTLAIRDFDGKAPAQEALDNNFLRKFLIKSQVLRPIYRMIP